MIFGVYSIRDELSGFMTPTLDQSDATAMRNFRMACSRSDSLMNFKASDFSLYCIGSFDSESGVIAPASPARLVCRGEPDA